MKATQWERALYLGNTEYRIHGTNQPSTIGHFVSSACIRLTNEDVEDLYNRVTVGTTRGRPAEFPSDIDLCGRWDRALTPNGSIVYRRTLSALGMLVAYQTSASSIRICSASHLEPR